MLRFIILSAVVLFGLSAKAGVSIKQHNIENILRLPLRDRIEALSVDKKNVKLLGDMAFDDSQHLDNRWRALTALGHSFPKDAKPHLEKALLSDHWYMRNAALIVLPYNEREWSVKWARTLLNDPALIVRTASVHVLRKLKATEATGLLWEKLYSQENFRVGKSLWIRLHILEALVQLSEPGDEQKFLKALQDNDASLHTVAIAGLEKLTNKRFATKNGWQNWWKIQTQNPI